MAQNSKAKVHSDRSSKPGSKKADEESTARHAAPSSVQPVETSENTGNDQQSQKGALEHNVAGQAQRHPATAPGQHATGSFTDEASKNK